MVRYGNKEDRGFIYMKNVYYMRYPEGAAKALTFSYDDGVEQDKRLVELFRQHGVKGAFNISTGLMGRTSPYWPHQRWMTADEIKDVFSGSGMEIACHSHTHPELTRLDDPEVFWEVLQNREILESLFGIPVHGFAYPQGAYDDRVVGLLSRAGIHYARTAHTSCMGFSQPHDWLRWVPTCHHGYPDLMRLAQDFLNGEPQGDPYLFYVWGHSYEFEFDPVKKWDIMERFLDAVSGKDGVWYATNMEICLYTKAFYALEYSVDRSLVTNRAAFPVWILCRGEVCKIDSGATVAL